MGAITPLAIDNTTVEVKSIDLINQGKSIAGSLAAWTLNERSKRNGGERVDSLIKRLVGGRTLREAEKGQLSAQTLLGLSLYLAEERKIEASIDILRSATTLTQCLPREEYLKLTAMLINSTCRNNNEDIDQQDLEEWSRQVLICKEMIKLFSGVLKKEIKDGQEANTSFQREMDKASVSLMETPREVAEKTWEMLRINSSLNVANPESTLLLIESRSLPRSGHHFLKNSLKRAFNGEFSYCEGYMEPGCCNSNPCEMRSYWNFARKRKLNHIRLVKSHDFNLTDLTFKPPIGMLRLIQVRKPLEVLVSWLELQQFSHNENLLNSQNIRLNRLYLYHEIQLKEEAWSIIDESGTVMDEEQTIKWLKEKANYIERFLKKWLPISIEFPYGSRTICGNYVLPYTHLANVHGVARALTTEDIDTNCMPEFKNKSNILERPSSKITQLIGDHICTIQKLDQHIRENMPKLQDGSKLDI